LRATGAVKVFGFRRQHRLLKPAAFADVFAARRVLRGTQFALHYRDNDLPVARLGLVISKKQAHTAVLRNAIKRQARDIFRLRLSTLPARDVVLRLTRAVAAQDKPAWRAEISHLLERLGRT
jgi:ribonuclease P protein component